MIEGSTCDDLSFSAPKLVTPEGDALPSHRQRVGENRRARRCVLAIDAVAKMRRKRAAYAPIRAHYHGMITIFWGSTRRARPRGVPGNSARQARAAADAGRLSSIQLKMPERRPTDRAWMAQPPQRGRRRVRLPSMPSWNLPSFKRHIWPVAVLAPT